MAMAVPRNFAKFTAINFVFVVTWGTGGDVGLPARMIQNLKTVLLEYFIKGRGSGPKLLEDRF